MPAQMFNNHKLIDLEADTILHCLQYTCIPVSKITIDIPCSAHIIISLELSPLIFFGPGLPPFCLKVSSILVQLCLQEIWTDRRTG